MNKYILCLAIGLVLGFLVALLFQLTLQVEKNSGNPTVGDKGLQLEQFISEQERHLNELSHEISQIKIAIADFTSKNEHPETTPASENNMAKEIIAPTKTGPDKIDRIEMTVGIDWIRNIDIALASILLEEGISPFDEGMSPILKKAITDVNSVNSYYEKIKKDIREKYPGVMYSDDKRWDDLRAEKAANEKQNNIDRQAILDEFRTSIKKKASRDE